MAVRPETVKKLVRKMAKPNAPEGGSLNELLRSGEAVDTNYGNDRRASIGFIDEESGEDGVRIFVRTFPPREPDDTDPIYIVVLTEDGGGDDFETDSPTEAIAKYREWRARWPSETAAAATRIARTLEKPPITVDTLTQHWCKHEECAKYPDMAKDCAKEHGIDLTNERRTVLLAIVDLWASGNLDDYTMTGFLGPALHDAGYRDIDTEPVGQEFGWMTATFLGGGEAGEPETLELNIERYGEDDPERERMGDLLKEQISNASPKQIDEYTKVLDDLLAIAPEGLLYLTVDRDLRRAVKERATGRWK